MSGDAGTLKIGPQVFVASPGAMWLRTGTSVTFEAADEDPSGALRPNHPKVGIPKRLHTCSHHLTYWNFFAVMSCPCRLQYLLEAKLRLFSVPGSLFSFTSRQFLQRSLLWSRGLRALLHPGTAICSERPNLGKLLSLLAGHERATN